MLHELRIVVRSLLKSRGFTFSALLVLALCIGANTAIFSVVNGVLWRPLAFKQPDRLVSIKEKLGNVSPEPWPPSTPDLLFLGANAKKSFEAMCAYTTREWELSGVDRSQRVIGLRVTPELFDTLGVTPQLGRVFTKAEDQQNARLAILSNATWHKSFGGSKDVLGRTIYLDRIPYKIVGVMPPAFVFPLQQHGFNGTPADIYTPMSFSKFERTGFGYMYNKTVLARLRPGVTLEQANAESSAVFRQFESYYPADFPIATMGHLGAVVGFYKNEVVGGLQRGLLMLMIAIGLVLLIACANIANLLLARSVHRRREFAVRLAIGARKKDIVRQGLLESLCITFAGGAIGILLAYWMLPLLIKLSPIDMPRVNDISIDFRTLAFTVAVCCILPIIFGLFPALETGGLDIAPFLRESGRSGTGSRRQRSWMSVAVTAQYALSLVLLIGAGLLLRSFLKLQQVDPGFRTQRIVAVSLKLPTSSYKTADSVIGFYRTLMDSVGSIPGVQSSGAISDLPLTPSDTWGVAFDGKPRDGRVPQSVMISWTSGEAMKALGFHLISGRLLSADDTRHSPAVLVVNQSLANRVWPGEDPIGKRMHLGGPPNKPNEWQTVVGVIADVRQGLHNIEVRPQAFQPQAQATTGAIASDLNTGLRGMTLIICTDLATEAISGDVRRALAHLDPALPIEKVQTLNEYVSGSINAQRYDTYLVGLFAGLALVLTIVGVAGVLLYSVAQRSMELGIRMALGGTQADMAKQVVGQGFRLAIIGIAAGTVAALGLTRLISGLLYETSAVDWVTLVAVPAVMLLTTLVASLIPVARAVRIDPAIALRE